MASEVEICNRALQKLGAKRITSLTEDAVNARSCNVAYAVLRDAELRAHPWSFAIKRAELAASSTAPLFGRENSFPLPSDFLRLMPQDSGGAIGGNTRTGGSFLNPNDLDWQIEGREIVTDFSSPLNIRYIARVTDPNLMDSTFREALSARMAWELCEELTQSNQKKASAREDYKDLIKEARRAGAIENIAQQPPEDLYVTVRN